MPKQNFFYNITENPEKDHLLLQGKQTL